MGTRSIVTYSFWPSISRISRRTKSSVHSLHIGLERENIALLLIRNTYVLLDSIPDFGLLTIDGRNCVDIRLFIRGTKATV